jgi:hypothetical protein
MHRRIPSRGVLRVPEATREAAMAAAAAFRTTRERGWSAHGRRFSVLNQSGERGRNGRLS